MAKFGEFRVSRASVPTFYDMMLVLELDILEMMQPMHLGDCTTPIGNHFSQIDQFHLHAL